MKGLRSISHLLTAEIVNEPGKLLGDLNISNKIPRYLLPSEAREAGFKTGWPSFIQERLKTFLCLAEPVCKYATHEWKFNPH